MVAWTVSHFYTEKTKRTDETFSDFRIINMRRVNLFEQYAPVY